MSMNAFACCPRLRPGRSTVYRRSPRGWITSAMLSSAFVHRLFDRRSLIGFDSPSLLFSPGVWQAPRVQPARPAAGFERERGRPVHGRGHGHRQGLARVAGARHPGGHLRIRDRNLLVHLRGPHILPEVLTSALLLGASRSICKHSYLVLPKSQESRRWQWTSCCGVMKPRPCLRKLQELKNRHKVSFVKLLRSRFAVADYSQETKT